MKPRLLTILIFLLFIFHAQVVYPQEDLITITPYNSEISPGEVYQAEITISNPVAKLKKQNIKVYSAGNITQAISPFLGEIEQNHYFLYFEIPVSTEEGEYFLRIEDQSFIIDNVLKVMEEERQFTVLHSEPSVSITPAYFKLSSKQSGQITVNAVAKDIQTQIEFSIPDYMSHSYITNQYLNPDSLRKFNFNYNTENASFGEIVFSYSSKKFTVPIFIEQSTEEHENTTEENKPETNSIVFLVTDNILDRKLKNTESLEGNVNIKNTLENSIDYLNMQLTGNLSRVILLPSETIYNITPLVTFPIFLKINPDKTAEEGIYDGYLILSNNDYTAKLQVHIEIYKEEETQQKEETEIIDTNIGVHEEISDGNEVVDNIIPWNLSGGFEDEVKSSASPFIFIIVLFLVLSIIIFLLSGKKKTQKKSFQQLMKENKR
ncbi:MAG: hypothetical protein Q8Q42_01645 [Nanoarchaeota archaeon]|nr:hypothetical protein [Nanoarchaeota archaeon]